MQPGSLLASRSFAIIAEPHPFKAIGPELPGHTTFAQCECGEIGIRTLNDNYRHFDVKKPVRVPYHQSPYRGGKMRT